MTAIPNLMTMAKQLLAESEVQRLLVLAMDRVVEISGAERGMIILFNENGKILFENARDLKREDIDLPEFEISRTIISKVKAEGMPICLRNALDDPTLKKSDSVSRLKILSVICLPLVHKEQTFGVVYLDNRSVRGVFKPAIYDFLKDFSDFVSIAAYNTLEKKRLNYGISTLEAELRAKYHFEAIIGSHPKMMEILKLVSQVANTDAIVLIQGESGTGKELIARALHYNSYRQSKPFVPVNCGALTENLLESELFGHVRGSFTGASSDKIGWFERAEGGTIFLDEVGEMSPGLQVKLLRVLQTGEYNRVGDTRIRQSSVRVIAATNANLQTLVAQGVFREDLFYRLNVIDITVPPLRERRSDIPLLIAYFLKIYSNKYNRTGIKLSHEAESLLLAYDFPGNCRELENILQHAIVVLKDNTIRSEHLPNYLVSKFKNIPVFKKQSHFRIAKQRVIEKFEQDYIIDCLTASNGNISQAAKMAGINVKNFHSKMMSYHIEAHSYKHNISK